MKIMLLLIVTLFTSGNNYNLAELRILYGSAVKLETKNVELISASERFLDNTTVKGYYGAGKIIMAKYYFMPHLKLKTFNEGKKILESAVKADPLNAELRFLRLSIQNNTPSFLGYNSNIEEDRLYLIKSLPSINDLQLKSIISNYLNTIHS